jgi:DNA polymerase I-like protein with 3'-5' exonuclease and polymerase domains
MLIFDLETDGLLDDVTKVHTLTTYDTDTKIFNTYDLAATKEGIRSVMEHPSICGHNIIAYDLPVIKKLFRLEPKGKVTDSMVMARLAYPDIKDIDYGMIRQKKFPGKYLGSHSLKAWGFRLGVLKAEFQTDWKEWSQEMSDYCVQDVKVTVELMNRVSKKELTPQSIDLEHEVQRIIYRQHRYGFLFDKEKAEQLYCKLLQRQKELTYKLQEFFRPWYRPEGEFTPKRGDKTKGYVKGATFTKVKYTEFNPASRAHICDRLSTLYGWQPKPDEYTEAGTPRMDEEIVKNLKVPEAPYLAEYFLVLKRIGQLAEGQQGWLQTVEKDGRIHGSVNTIGAVTRRMTHSHPNIAQVPRAGSPYGEECRQLFTVPPGKSLVGVDASGLELRCLAHYMSQYDNGAYIDIVTKGNQQNETDVHSQTCIAIGLKPKEQYELGGKVGFGRDFAKTFVYAFLYGAGEYKLGSIVGKGAHAGKAMKNQFFERFPALRQLKDNVEAVAIKKGVLRSLDGAPMKVRSIHAALNTLLQGAGALVMKQALVITDHALKAHGYTPGKEYEFVANIHDEWQAECDKAIARTVGETSIIAIGQAGNALNMRCPLAGEYKIGSNWAETH